MISLDVCGSDGGQHPLGFVHQQNVQLSRCAKPPITLHVVDGVVKFGGQFHARGARADDADAQTVKSPRRHLQRGFKKLALKTPGLIRPVEHQAIFFDALYAEVIDAAAERQNQIVIGDGPFTENFRSAFRAVDAADADGFQHRIEPEQFAHVEGVAMGAPMRQIIDLVIARSDQARRHFMEARLP